MIVLRTASGAGVQVISPGARTVQVVAADEAGLKGAWLDGRLGVELEPRSSPFSVVFGFHDRTPGALF
jgi:hypothetical protein